MAVSEADRTRRATSEILIRAVLCLITGVVFLAVSSAIIYFATNGKEAASRSLIQSVPNGDDVDASIMALLGIARNDLLAWNLTALLVAVIAAMIFIAVAQRRDPRTDQQAEMLFGLWGGLLIVTLAVCALLWWSTVGSNQVGESLAPSTYLLVLTVTGITAFLGYFVCTAMIVKHAAKRSVPLGAALPSFRR